MSWLIKQGILDWARVSFIDDLLVFMQLSDTHDTPVFKSGTDTPATPFLQSLTLFFISLWLLQHIHVLEYGCFSKRTILLYHLYRLTR